MSAIENIAPYPERAEDVTAEVMAKYFTVFAQLNWRMGMDHPSRDQAAESSSRFVAFYAIAYLLREQPAREGDRVAKSLWESWENPHTLGPDVWNWLVEYDIDPETVNKIAADLIAKDAAASVQGTEDTR
ncbi:hypothetical protein [Planobispora rosea]|uniref:hypothetical protein n=1 Tax=Planobispora rosea TaxID=35762 RepID=UPI00083B2AAB|nr:hypothetical protein [Planobispora rosea]